MLNCTLYLNERQHLLDSVSHKYPNFHPLSANDIILFSFNNVDPFVCKKLGHLFIFLAFEKRESRSLNIATQARRNEFESERARLSWADTSPLPPNPSV